MNGIKIDIPSGKKSINQAEPIDYQSFSHVRFINSVPEIQHYPASPHSYINGPTTFEMYLEPNLNKHWGINVVKRGNAFDVQIIFNSDVTDRYNVLYVKRYFTQKAADTYRDKSVLNKVQKKDYVSAGESILNYDDFTLRTNTPL
jgi:hypothetical protein